MCWFELLLFIRDLLFANLTFHRRFGICSSQTNERGVLALHLAIQSWYCIGDHQSKLLLTTTEVSKTEGAAQKKQKKAMDPIWIPYTKHDQFNRYTSTSKPVKLCQQRRGRKYETWSSRWTIWLSHRNTQVLHQLLEQLTKRLGRHVHCLLLIF